MGKKYYIYIYIYQKASGKELPEWVTPQIYDDLQYMNAMDFHFLFFNDEMIRLRSG